MGRHGRTASQPTPAPSGDLSQDEPPPVTQNPWWQRRRGSKVQWYLGSTGWFVWIILVCFLPGHGQNWIRDTYNAQNTIETVARAGIEMIFTNRRQGLCFSISSFLHFPLGWRIFMYFQLLLYMAFVGLIDRMALGANSWELDWLADCLVYMGESMFWRINALLSLFSFFYWERYVFLLGTYIHRT